MAGRAKAVLAPLLPGPQQREKRWAFTYVVGVELEREVLVFFQLFALACNLLLLLRRWLSL